MKCFLTGAVSAFLLLAASAGLRAQEAKVTIVADNITTAKALGEIERQTDYLFIYNVSDVDVNRSFRINVREESVSKALTEIFKGTNVSHSVQGKNIMLKINNPAPSPASVEKTSRITGTVRDAADGEPLIGVNVLIKNRRQTGTATDINGNYIIDAEIGDIIEFTYVGYIGKEVTVTGQITLDVELSYNTELLEQAAVVGYGTQKRISIIGAQQSISINEIKVPVANLTQSLAGRVAGVVSMQRSGEPGNDDASIYIRGISTLTAGMSAPLTLVDGVPRNISNVDPEDIESFSILKDASATAIYGVRGANGVIIINTKSGSAGKPKFDIRYTEGFTRFVSLPDFVDAPKYMELSNEALMTRGQEPRYSQYDISQTASGEDPYLYPNVDWMDVLFKDMGHNRTANANISGGSDKAVYYIGLGYFDEEGLYNVDKQAHDYNANTFYKRYSVTSNITLTPTQNTEIKLGIQGYLANANYPFKGNSDIFNTAFYATPNYIAPKYPNGAIGDQPAGNVQNPYAVLNELGYANQWRSQIFSNLRLTQKLPFIEWLSVTGMFSFDAYNYTSNRFGRTPNTFMALGRDSEGKLILQQTLTGTETLSYANTHSGNREIYLEGGINYKRSFGRHDVTGMLLYNQSDDLNTLATSVETALPYRFRGLAGRFTYAFDERYFMEFNFGYNGSENFAPKHRYGFFPSFGLGWVLSNEKFFEPLKDAVQFVKFRATWGKVGNANITGRRFAYLATVATGGSVYKFGKTGDQSFDRKSIGDEAVDVTWETAQKYNLGMDIITLKNNLKIQVDVFKDFRNGIFLTRGSIPWYTGIERTPLGNIGVVENKGIEVSLDYHNQINDDWFISALGNFSFNRNKVVENDLLYTYPWQDLRGQRVGQRFGYIAEKLFESEEEVEASAYQPGDTRPGDIKFKDLNGDGQINSYDKAPIGWGAVPEIIYGFGFNVAWKNIALSAMFQGAAHVDALVSGEGVTPFEQGLSRGNILSNIDDRWTEANPRQDVFYPRLSPSSTSNMNYEQSSWFVKSTDYLRLKNLQLSYTLPKIWVQKVNISNATVFLQGVNVLTFSSFKLWDVEQGDGRGNVYPNTSSYSIGINFSF